MMQYIIWTRVSQIELASKKDVDNSHEARYNGFLQFL